MGEEGKPKFEDTHCPRCGDSDGICGDEAVQMVTDEMRVIWCAAGHITIIDNESGKVTQVEGFGQNKIGG